MKTYKKLGAIAAIYTLTTMSASASLIVGWNQFVVPSAIADGSDVNPHAGITATLSYDNGATTDFNRAGVNRGSNDGTYGNIAGAPLNQGLNSDGITTTRAAYIDFKITNSGPGSLELTSFNFDSWRRFNGSINEYRLDVLAGSGITVGSVVPFTMDLGPGNGALPSNDDFHDVTENLAGLADHTLTSGESATLRFEVRHQSNTTPGAVYFDNFEFEGNVTAVPEPSTVGALLLIGLVSIGGRRKRSI